MIFMAERRSGCGACQLVCSLCREGERNPFIARLVGETRGTLWA